MQHLAKKFEYIDDVVTVWRGLGPAMQNAFEPLVDGTGFDALMDIDFTLRGRVIAIGWTLSLRWAKRRRQHV